MKNTNGRCLRRRDGEDPSIDRLLLLGAVKQAMIGPAKNKRRAVTTKWLSQLSQALSLWELELEEGLGVGHCQQTRLLHLVQLRIQIDSARARKDGKKNSNKRQRERRDGKRARGGPFRYRREGMKITGRERVPTMKKNTPLVVAHED